MFLEFVWSLIIIITFIMSILCIQPEPFINRNQLKRNLKTNLSIKGMKNKMNRVYRKYIS